MSHATEYRRKHCIECQVERLHFRGECVVCSAIDPLERRAEVSIHAVEARLRELAPDVYDGNDMLPNELGEAEC